MTMTMRRWELDGVGRDRLNLRGRPIPSPGRCEVLVKVAAVALNHRDKMVIESGRGLPLAFPFTPGWPRHVALRQAAGEGPLHLAVTGRWRRRDLGLAVGLHA